MAGSDVQLLPVIKIAPNCEDLIFEFYGFIPQVPAFSHSLEFDYLVGFYVEFEYFLVEALRPSPS